MKRMIAYFSFGLIFVGVSSLALSYGKGNFKKAPTKAHPYYNEGKSISGVIDVSDELKKKNKVSFDADDVVFIIVKKAGSATTRTPPIAVSRLHSLKGKSFPLKFTVGSADVMMGDESQFVGPFSLKVKLSRTGDAMSSPGDFIGYSGDKPIKVGEKQIKVVLNEVVSKKQEMTQPIK